MIDVSAAVILRDGQVLICKRPQAKGMSGLWEFPGGKREAGESPEECLVRECAEELGVDIEVTALLAEADSPYATKNFHVRFFSATIVSGEPGAKEHDAIRWVEKCALFDYAFCPADASILPIVAALP